ncbi:hypothetical protein, partial [Caballeronia sp. NCTM1]|uniref:hypothetical protein n=1 Tax=Caballeronia sp. NCTM1 TaxID=2921753 RepID=UPI0020297E7D
RAPNQAPFAGAITPKTPGSFTAKGNTPRNLHAKEMRIDLERAGVPLDDATIKKYLDEARRLRKSLIDGGRSNERL